MSSATLVESLLASIEGAPQGELVGLLCDVERLRAAIWMRLLSGRVGSPESDRLLTIDEASMRLATSEDWLRRHGDLPFVVRLSEGQVRYSEQGIDEFIRAQRSNGTIVDRVTR